MEYKAEITLNEKDSLTDIYLVEQGLIMEYARALAECLNDKLAAALKRCFESAVSERLKTLKLLKEHKYVQEEQALPERVCEIKRTFTAAGHGLS